MFHDNGPCALCDAANAPDRRVNLPVVDILSSLVKQLHGRKAVCANLFRTQYLKVYMYKSVQIPGTREVLLPGLGLLYMHLLHVFIELSVKKATK